MLNASFNQLTGSLPSEVQSAPAHAALDVSHNFISGALPPLTGAAPYMQLLHVQSNKITGALLNSNFSYEVFMVRQRLRSIACNLE